MNPAAADRAVIERYMQVWTPTIMLLAPSGQVYHEWSGYLPPNLFMPQLQFGLAKVALKSGQFADAADQFDRIAEVHSTADVAPDALYWSAVARYRGSGQPADLMRGWAKLRAAYPASVARVRQSFVEG